MKESHDLVINMSFFVFLVIMIYLNYNNLLSSKLDLGISILAIIISITLLLFKTNSILDTAHFLYCIVYLFSVSFISENQYLLVLNIIMISVIIFSRYYYNGCLLNKKQNNIGYFSNLNTIVKKYFFFWNWDYLFPLLLLVSSGRFMKLKGYL